MTAEQLYDQVKDLPFHCETCGGFHPLREHRDCRNQAVQALAAQARHAITSGKAEKLADQAGNAPVEQSLAHAQEQP